MTSRAWKGLVPMTAALVAVLAAAGPAGAQPKALAGVGPAAAPAAEGGGPAGLHIPQGRTINFEHTLTDGAGYVWNLQPYANVGSGTNNAYAGGMYLHINGSNLPARGQGWANEAGDEIEIGPMPGRFPGLQVYRRVKVYKDVGTARWLDIFQNTSGQPLTFTARLYSNFNWSVARMITPTGGAAAGERDWAFVTETGAGPGSNIPSVLHVFGDRKGKLRPRVMLQGNSLHMEYSLTVPAGATTILCHFEVQNTSVEALVKDMQNLKAAKLLKDLPSRVRGLVANFTAGAAGLDLDLERSESADTVLLADDDPIYGTIRNESFAVQTLLGALSLPADKVIGMLAVPGEEDQVRYVLADGEVISGRSPGAKITVGLPSGGQLEIPLSKVKSWSYRISKKHPEDLAASGPVVVLRTGDQLAFNPQGTQLAFRTQYGRVEVKAEELLEILLDNASNGVHRAVFLNGSRLAGFLEPEKITLSLKLEQKLEVPRDMISRIRFASEEKEDEGLCQAVLGNGDELRGAMEEEVLTIQTQYGTVDLKPDTVKTFTFTASQPGRAALLLWDGTVLRGQLQQEELTYRLQPGPALKVPVGHFTSIARSKVLPPEDVRKKVEKWVAMLGAESFKDRQSATEELIKMGPSILPLLQKYLADGDPEVRQRIAEVLEKLGLRGGPAPAYRGPRMMID